jgi:hypothetical protein
MNSESLPGNLRFSHAFLLRFINAAPIKIGRPGTIMKPRKLGINPLKNIESGGMVFKKAGKEIPKITKPSATKMYPMYFIVFLCGVRSPSLSIQSLMGSL